MTVMESNNKKINFMRHGDRNFRTIESIGLDKIPSDLPPSESKIVGVGESWHRHKISGQCVVYDMPEPQQYKYEGRTILVDQFVDVLEDTTVTHEEHHEIPIQKGQYALVPEQEIDILEQKTRSVLD